MNSWYQITVELPLDALEAASSILFELGSCGLEEKGVDGKIGRLTAFFASEIGCEGFVREIKARLPAASVSTSGVETLDWAATWRDRFEPVWPTDRTVICAPWHDVDPPEDGFRILIEPKTAFGTGGHETTRLALRGLEAVVRPGDRVLDVGTGSGILAIAARKLGAKAVTAIDTDPLATENVWKNVSLNDVTQIVAETRSVTADDRGYQVVVANIISSILTPMLGKLRAAAAPGASVIFGGLLSRERQDFTSSLEKMGFMIVEVIQEAEWIGFTTSKS